MAEPRSFKRVLITGIAGSGGSYLAEYIIRNHPNVEVHGISRWHSTTQDNLELIANQVSVHECDLNDFGSILKVLQHVRPDAIFHLAAYANVRTSFITPSAVLNNNVTSTCNLFEAIRTFDINPVIQLCSTSEVYGQVKPEDIPIKENVQMQPASPYAVSKATQDLLGWTYFVSYEMLIIRTRMFAYFNPRRTDLFATSFARQVVRIEAGLQKELLHGNLDSVRTMIDVRDAMSAYWAALIHCDPGEVYNIGGTTTITVDDFLKRLISLAKTSIPTRLDPKLLRPADVTLQIPCVEKFTKKTNWKAEYNFDQSLDHLLEFWRARVKTEKMLSC